MDIIIYDVYRRCMSDKLEGQSLFLWLRNLVRLFQLLVYDMDMWFSKKMSLVQEPNKIHMIISKGFPVS